jgi:hypothetical protein
MTRFIIAGNAAKASLEGCSSHVLKHFYEFRQICHRCGALSSDAKLQAVGLGGVGGGNDEQGAVGFRGKGGAEGIPIARAFDF